jgi:hypothetical protein
MAKMKVDVSAAERERIARRKAQREAGIDPDAPALDFESLPSSGADGRFMRAAVPGGVLILHVMGAETALCFVPYSDGEPVVPPRRGRPPTTKGGKP